MQTSATGRLSRGTPRQAGFTLIELLVVTAILATLSLAAVLSLRLAPGETPAAHMEELVRAVRYLQAEAMYTRRSFAVSFTRGSWRVLELDEANEHWQPRAEGRPYREGGWNPDFSVELEIEGRRIRMGDMLSDQSRPDVLVLSNGETTPFSLSLEDDSGRKVRCRVDVFGKLQCRRGA